MYEGVGALATSDNQVKVDVAIYAKPPITDDGTIVFIMADRLTHHNLQSNDHSAYLFMEEGPSYKDKRLFLKKLREEKDSELLYSSRSKKYTSEKETGKARFFGLFRSRGGLSPDQGRSRKLDNQRSTWQGSLATPKRH